MFRVYDTKKKCWVKDNIYMAKDKTLYKAHKDIFGRLTLNNVSNNDRYSWQLCTDIEDKNGKMIYESDYVDLEIEDGLIVRGRVGYAREIGSYVAFCDDREEYFPIGTNCSNYIRLVGNMFEEDSLAPLEVGVKNKEKEV